MKYAVDHVSNQIVLLENIENKNKIEVDLDELPSGVKDGDVVTYDNGKYLFDNKTKEQRLKVIKDKMEKLKTRK